MSNYTRQVIPWGNSFTLFIHLDKFEDGQYENFDLHTAKSIEVKLLCGTHNIEIPLDYEIVEDNVFSCFVDYRLLHTNNSYGVIVEGYDADDIHWRWTLMPREGILIVTNTSGMKIDNNVMTVDLQGRVGWGIEKVIHADWAEEDETAASYIENKPDLSIYTSYSYIQDNYATLDDLNDYTTYTYIANNYATQGDLSNYAPISYVVQADWNETDTSSYAYIQNKPNISSGSGFVQFTNPNDSTKVGLVNSLSTMYDTNIGNKAVIEGDGINYGSSIKNIKATGQLSHAEGHGAQALNDYAHAEGMSTQANGKCSHVEGDGPKANGLASHAEGSNTQAGGNYSHTSGCYTNTNNQSEFALGQFNVTTGNSGSSFDNTSSTATLFSVGNGTGANNRHNAFEIKRNGDIYITYNGNDVKLQSYIGDLSQYATLSDLTNYVQASDLATVATTGNYNDLSYLPDLSQFTSYTYLESNYATLSYLSNYQEVLVSGQNIKTINNQSLLGSGDITIQGGGGGGFVQFTYNGYTGLINSLTTTYDFNIGQGAVIEGYSDYGYLVKASGQSSHAEGLNTIASGNSSHAEGVYSEASGIASHAEGQSAVASGTCAHAEGVSTTAAGFGAHSEGYETKANADYSHAEGNGTSVTGESSHAEGQGTVVSGKYGAHGEGKNTTAIGDCSHTEGESTYASKWAAHAEGYGTHAHGNYSHAEGVSTYAYQQAAHAEGNASYAKKNYSHAEGDSTEANGNAAHAEGYRTHATGGDSHAEGSSTYATNYHAHAEGETSYATGQSSHAEGVSTNAYNFAEHASGHFNLTSFVSANTFDNTSATATLFSVGNGTDANNRHNAFEIKQNGDIYITYNGGDVKLQSYLGGGGGSQVQSDWTESDPTVMSYILNKPDLSNYATQSDLSYYALSSSLATVATSGDYNDLNNTPTIPPAQVQANWNESDPTSFAYILNKPDLSNYATQSDLSSYVQASSLNLVATTGDYSYLINTPTIPAAQVQSNWNETNTSSKAYILNKPTIPAAQVQSDWNETNTSSKAYIQHKPDLSYKVSSSTSGVKIEVVNSLPASPASKTIYIII